MRENVIARLREGRPLFDGIIGYEDSVIPQIVNAVLSRHDILFLGLRGQAKTRMIRSLPNLLDEYSPVVDGAELPDDPLDPQFGRTKSIIEEHGDDTPIRWVHRSDRFHEKLATPDVTIADLIGEIDLVKHAEGRYLSDDTVMHFGLIPRTNRGIFAINELPDLAPRIQVGLFNVLEERDVQIRGFPIRMPLDICVVFSANPEDYTNRGRIVTPLKDRIGSVIRTHYPTSNEHAMNITKQNAWLDREDNDRNIDIPPYLLEIIEETARLARTSAHVNQQSGVSARISIANAEILVANAERRAVIHGEKQVVPRVSDLTHVSAGCRGKLELMLADDEKTEDRLIDTLVGEAVKNIFEKYAEIESLEDIINRVVEEKLTIEIGDELSAEQAAAEIKKVPPLQEAAEKLLRAMERRTDSPQELAGAGEFILEALYVNNRLSKYEYQQRTFFKR
jgi:magnesium chelatase subunit I